MFWTLIPVRFIKRKLCKYWLCLHLQVEMEDIGPVLVGPFSYSVSLDHVIAVHCFELSPEA